MSTNYRYGEDLCGEDEGGGFYSNFASQPHRPIWRNSYRPRGFERLGYHWHKHVIEQWEWKRYLSERAYRDLAYDLFETRLRGGGAVRQAIRANGDIIRFNIKTGEFGVLSAEGRVTTFFIPRPSPILYWFGQEAEAIAGGGIGEERP
jgi:hypothetical protein